MEAQFSVGLCVRWFSGSGGAWKSWTKTKNKETDGDKKKGGEWRFSLTFDLRVAHKSGQIKIIHQPEIRWFGNTSPYLTTKSLFQWGSSVFENFITWCHPTGSLGSPSRRRPHQAVIDFCRAHAQDFCGHLTDDAHLVGGIQLFLGWKTDP